MNEFLDNKCEIILACLFITYLIIANENDEALAVFIDIPQVKGFIIVITILLFVYCNKIVGVLGLFVAYELLSFSHSILNEYPIKNEPPVYYNREIKKSIEEEIIYRMTPCLGNPVDKCSYKPFSTNVGFYL